MSPDNNSWVPLKKEEIGADVSKIIEVFINETPNLPVHVHKLLDIVSDSNSDALDVANAASADPGLVSKILRVINSSYYGLSKRTDNIHFAIVLLGFDEVRKIALQTSFQGMFNEGTQKTYSTKGLWQHSYLVSVCAETLGRRKDTKHAGELLTFGILHDIGKFVLFKLAIAMKNKGIAPFRPVTEADNFTQMEKEEAHFRINHQIVGSLLAKKWDLSERIQTILELHHDPSYLSPDDIPADYLKDVATISISDAIVNHYSGRGDTPEPPPAFFDAIGLAGPVATCISGELEEKLDEAKRYISST